MLFNIFIAQAQDEKLNSFQFNETREKSFKEKCKIISEKKSLELGNQREFKSSCLWYMRTHGSIHFISIKTPIKMRYFQNYKHGYLQTRPARVPLGIGHAIHKGSLYTDSPFQNIHVSRYIIHDICLPTLVPRQIMIHSW